MKISFIVLLILSSVSTHASLRTALSYGTGSYSLEGDFADGSNGELNGTTTQTELNLTYRWLPNFGFDFVYNQKELIFNDEDNVIDEGEVISLTKYGLGVHWIVVPRVQFKFMFMSAEEVWYEVDSAQADVKSEAVSFLRIMYDQIILLGATWYLGGTLGHDLDSKGSDITKRSNSFASLFFNYRLGRIVSRIDYTYNATKIEVGDDEFTGPYSMVGLSFSFLF